MSLTFSRVASRRACRCSGTYCETYYSASQPMDVEHWRPKGEVHLEDGTVLKPGYYWLAAHWDNLLPSCIDCNRGRGLTGRQPVNLPLGVQAFDLGDRISRRATAK